MAGAIRYMSRMNFNLLNNNVTRQLILNGNRTLYTESSLGMIDYRSTRDTLLRKYQMGIDAFRTKMENIVASDKDMVFTEDLKAILHLVEKTPQEVELLKKLLIKFNSQNSELRFGSFKFGPIVMRTLHYLNEPDAAKELYLDDNFGDFFEQFSTYMVLLDLLYENQRYQDVREVYDKIRTKYTNGISHPRTAINVVGMACYKENTPESLEYGLQICRDLNQKGVTPIRRFISILGALALKQNKPHYAREIIEQVQSLEYISIKCIKILALAEMDRVDEITMEFQQSLKRGFPEKNQYYSDVLVKVEELIKRMNIDENAEICKVFQQLKESNYFNDLTMEEHISRPIQVYKNLNNQKPKYQDDGWGSSSSPRQYNRTTPQFEKRPRQFSDYDKQTNRYSSG